MSTLTNSNVETLGQIIPTGTSLEINAALNDSSTVRNGDQEITCCSLQVTEDDHISHDSRRESHPIGSWLLLPVLAIPTLLLATALLALAHTTKTARIGESVIVEFPAHVQIRMVNAQWTELFVRVNGINVSYYHSIPPTAGLPKLVYYHSGGTDGSEGIDLFSPFVNDFEIFCPSARGFGNTTNAQPAGTAEMVLDAIALLPVFDPDGEKVFMAAHSMGATVAPRVAKEHPEYVAGLVLEDPGWLRREGEPPSENAPGTVPEGGDNLSNESVEDIQVPTLILMAEFGDGVPEVLDAALASYPLGSKYFFQNAPHCIHCAYLALYRQVVHRYFYGLLGAS